MRWSRCICGRRSSVPRERTRLRCLRSLSAMRYSLRRRLLLHRFVSYMDATHLTPRERRPYIAMADLYGCSVAALYFDVPLDVCKQRNLARARVVPDEAMDLLASRLVPPNV